MSDATLLTRPAASPAPGRSPSRRGPRLLAVALASLLVLGAACSDDDGGDEADRSTTESTEPAGSTGSTDSTTTTVDNSQGKPLNETEELIAALAEPTSIAVGLVVSPEQVGDGSFQPTLCPDHEIDVTWEDQASQGLVRTEQGTLIVQQSVLAFPDAEAAGAFVDAYAAAVSECNPQATPEEVPDLGDRTVRITVPGDAGPSAVGALVQSGVHVVYLLAQGEPVEGLETIVDNDLITRLVALLPT